MEKMKIKNGETRTTYLCEVEGHSYVRTLIVWNDNRPNSISWHLNEDTQDGQTYLDDWKLEQLFLLGKELKSECYVLTDRGESGKIFVTFDPVCSIEIQEEGNFLMQIAEYIDDSGFLAKKKKTEIEAAKEELERDECDKCSKEEPYRIGREIDSVDLRQVFEKAIGFIGEHFCKTSISDSFVKIIFPTELSYESELRLYQGFNTSSPPHISFISLTQDISEKEFKELHDRAEAAIRKRDIYVIKKVLKN